jgi:hypothetical protein
MKVILPTNDGLAIAQEINKASAFRCMTIINGYVKEDVIKMVSSDSGGNLPFNEFFDSSLNNSDINWFDNPLYQQFVIASEIPVETENEFQKVDFKWVKSTETNIVNAINAFLKTQVTRESDYLCEP